MNEAASEAFARARVEDADTFTYIAEAVHAELTNDSNNVALSQWQGVVDIVYKYCTKPPVHTC